MMVKARSHIAIKISVFILLTLSFSIFSYAKVNAHGRHVGDAKNQPEIDRSALCSSSAPFVRGVTWINDIPTSNGTDARWNESITIASDAGFVDLTMWSTAYVCPSSPSDRTDIKIFGLAFAPGGAVDISFPFGTEIIRGDAPKGHFTDVPGSLPIRINFTNKDSGCYTVAYTGTYSDNRGTGQPDTYMPSVCIARSPPPPPPPPPPDPDPPPTLPPSCPVAPQFTSSNSTPNVGQQFTLSWSLSGGQPGSARIIVVRFKAEGSTNDKTTPSNFFSGSLSGPPGSKTGSENLAGRWTYIIAIRDSAGDDCYAFVRVYVSGSAGPVDNNPPTVSVRGNCTNVYFTVGDADRPSQGMDVHFYATSASGSYYNIFNTNGSQTANQGESGFAYPPAIRNGESHTITAIATSLRSDGTSNQNSTRSASLVIPACVSGKTFNLTLQTPSVTNFLPSDDAPNSATFNHRVRADINDTINGVSVTRRYYRIPRVGSPANFFGPQTNPSVSVAAGEYSFSESQSFPLSGVGDQICIEVTLTPITGEVSTTGAISNPSGTSTLFDCIPIASKPYFRVYGGDVVVGFPGTCTDWITPTAGRRRILGWNNGSGAGAAVRLAAMAMDQINGFSSATGRATDPMPPKGLTFANIGAGAPGSTYGGGFSANPCPKQGYFDTSVVVSPAGATMNVSDNAILQDGIPKRVTGDKTLNAPSQISGTKTLYVQGRVYINSNIVYENPGGGWSINNIPKFTLVVRGSLYIDNDVTQLDGTYVVLPYDFNVDGDYSDLGEGGVIYTCSTAASTPATTTNIFNECGGTRKLTINGQFIAQKIKLLRAVGTLSNSSNTEASGSPTIAESFVLSPEAWLAKPSTPGAGFGTTYDSITALPPIL